MKKILLFGAAAFVAASANAQACFVDLTTVCALGEDGKPVATQVPDHTLMCEDENGAMYIAYAENAKPSGIQKGFKFVSIDGGDAIEMTSGLAGDGNPTFVSYEEGIPTAGWVFQVTAKKDGWMTMLGKINPNKQYLVMGETSIPIPYTLGVANSGSEADSFIYSQPQYTSGDEEGTIDFTQNEGQKYFVVATKQVKNEEGLLGWVAKNNSEDIVWAATKPEEGENGAYVPLTEEIPGQNKPQFPYITAGYEKAPGEGQGMIQFRCYEGMTFTVCALGSKWGCNGFIYTEEQPAITFTDGADLQVTLDKDQVIYGTGSVDSIVVNLDENAPIYNLNGVRVNSDAKGILIQNGKKIVRF